MTKGVLELLLTEDLSEGGNLLSLYNDLDFRLGRPSLKTRYSVFSLRQYQLPIGSSFLSGIEGSAKRPISNDDYPLLMITYVNPVWYIYCALFSSVRACKMYM